MNVNVVTSIVGDGRDVLLDDQIHDPRLNYVAFTDQPSNLWKIKKPCNIFNDDRQNAKIHKILIHKYVECDVSIWIDGNIKLIKSPMILIDKYMSEYDMILLKHPPKKNNIIDEARWLISSQNEYPNLVINQLNSYPNCDKLFWNCFLIRKHTDAINNLNEKWWTDICVYGFRDQLSLPKIISDNNNVKIIDLNEYSQYFARIPHVPILKPDLIF
jgi:hypothetical protein